MNTTQIRFASLVRRLRNGSLGAEHALVIVRKGYLITDEYFAGWTPDEEAFRRQRASFLLY